LEVTAIVIQEPFHKMKSKELKAESSPGTIKVVTSGGAHGLPRDDEASPLALLDRLKSGGAYDCGNKEIFPPQRNKEILPALSIMADGNVHFSIDYHARLSALQVGLIVVSQPSSKLAKNRSSCL
jgi:hypothetical protein